MKHIYFLLPLLLFYGLNTFGQFREIKEFQDKKTKSFVSNGENKSKGLKFSLQYPTSYNPTDFPQQELVKGFCSSLTDACFVVALLKHEQELSPEGKTYMLSQEILKKSMASTSPTSQFLNYKKDFRIAGFPSAYIEFKADYDKDHNAYFRNYTILIGKYAVMVSFIIPIRKLINANEAIKTFNDYDAFFKLVINSFKALNVKEENKLDFEISDYLLYKEGAPELDKNKSNDTWIDELYRNKKYKFRIVFPQGWVYDGGTSKSTLARAYNRDKAASISIVVRPIDPIKNKDSNNIQKMPPISNVQMNKILELQNMKAENFKSEKGYLNNFPAYLYEFTSKQSAGTESYTYLSKQIQCLCGNKIYVLAINLPIENWDEEMIILFDRVVKSFVFEIAF